MCQLLHCCGCHPKPSALMAFKIVLSRSWAFCTSCLLPEQPVLLIWRAPCPDMPPQSSQPGCRQECSPQRLPLEPLPPPRPPLPPLLPLLPLPLDSEPGSKLPPPLPPLLLPRARPRPRRSGIKLSSWAPSCLHSTQMGQPHGQPATECQCCLVTASVMIGICELISGHPASSAWQGRAEQPLRLG